MKCEVGLTSPMGQFDLNGACRNCAIACYGLLAAHGVFWITFETILLRNKSLSKNSASWTKVSNLWLVSALAKIG